jgi:cyclopropane fatty-acyl-phospholipid synthase-like methyltransferase
MHFGYYRAGLDPFSRDRMLEEMSRQVLSRLGLPAGRPVRLADLGCGFASTSRLAAGSSPEVAVDAVTIVPAQVQEARRLTAAAGLADRVAIHHADYTATGLPPGSYDGVFAIESACHDAGPDKRRVLAEAARLLAPGATLVVADGFLRRRAPLGRVLDACHRAICTDWAVGEFARLPLFLAAAEQVGLEIVAVEDVSWRIAPSVAHIPWVTLRFLWHEWRRHGLALGRVRWGHLRACLLAPLLGAARRRFGYFLVTARRRH